MGLKSPCQKLFQPDPLMRQRIAEYFHAVLGGPKKRIQNALPAIMPSWGRIKFLDGGDSIRTSSTVFNTDQDRDTSFVRVCIILCLTILY